MSQTLARESGIETTLANVRELLPGIEERVEEIEQARSVPKDIVESLRTAGVFRRYVPRSHGGDEIWPDEGITVIEDLAAVDGSVGWVAAVGSEGPGFYAYLPPETYDEIYANGPDVIHSGVINPTGKVTPDGDGYRFTGKWSFGSGSATADLIVISGMYDDGQGGPPQTRLAVVPRSAVTIVDMWHVSGLKGTGSNDIVVDNLYVPKEWAGNFMIPPAVPRHPLDSRPLFARFGLEFAAVAVGIAQGAMNDIVKIAKDKIPATSQTKLAADPVTQYMLGSLNTDLYTARLLLHDIARTDQATAIGGTEEVDDAMMVNRKARLAKVGALCAHVVDGAYSLSGTTGLFESCPLQRRLRDVRAVTQHYMLSERSAFGPAGGLLLG